MRKRNHIVALHLNTQELQHLNSLAGQSGWPREELLRSLIAGTQIRAKPCTHHADLMRQVAGLCNNANQIAHVANRTGQVSQQSVDELLNAVRALWEEVRGNW